MKTNIIWFYFVLLCFVVTLPVTWWGLAKADFFYSTLYDAIGIDKHIERYAPKNRYDKRDFVETSKAQRVELFHEVVVAIHNKGEGLDSLSYNAVNEPKKVLSTDAEVTHLQDVANLLEKLKTLVFLVSIVWLVAILWMYLKRMRVPSAQSLVTMFFIWLVIAILVLLLGPEKVFNQLHIWVFPDDNQWFFYYEESLMSTIMKAPQLFGYISLIWVIASLVLSLILFSLLHLLLNRTRKSNYEYKSIDQNN